MTLAPGHILQNRYRLGAQIKQGGMSVIYRAWDLRLSIPVAIKEMMPYPGISPQALAQLRQQFWEEATTLARLSHPNLVRVMDFFEEQGNNYLVMDFVEGRNLEDLVEQEGALPEQTVLSRAEQLLDALAYCHNLGIVHRDIKPQNIIVRPDGQTVLVDFGLVKLWDPQVPGTRTVIHGVGTPGYAPPEQYGAVHSHTDARSDLYSLAATLYFALTAKAPPSATQRMAAPEEFLPVRALKPGTSPQTEAVIMRAMQLSSDQRFSDASEMQRAVRRPAEDGDQRARALSSQLSPRVGRLALLSLSGLVILALIVSIGLAVTQRPTTPPTSTAAGILASMHTPTPARTQTQMRASEPTPTHTRVPRPTRILTLKPTSTPRPTPKPTRTLTPTPLPTPTPMPFFYASVLVDELNVRKGPGTSHAAIGQVHKGDCLAVQGWSADKEWLGISIPSGGGWVSALYVNADRSSQCDGSSPRTAIDPQFRSDDKTIAAGQCTTLRWDVEQVRAVYLNEIGKPGHWTHPVCPATTQLFVLTVVSRDDRQWFFPLTVQVSGSLSLPRGPLTIEYSTTNVWCPTSYGYIAEFYVWATGGDGRYTYYRDIDRIGGPTSGGITYRLSWTSCGGAPGTFLVESGGQRAEKSFWIDPPACCSK